MLSVVNKKKRKENEMITVLLTLRFLAEYHFHLNHDLEEI